MATALVIAVLISAVELTLVARHEREKASALVESLLDMAEHSAGAAAWNLDRALADEVLAGLSRLKAVREARITDDQGSELAAIGTTSPDAAASGLFGVLVGDAGTGRRALTHALRNGRAELVGHLEVTLDEAVAGSDFTAYAMTTVIGGLLRNLALGLVLTWSGHRFLTRPIVAIARAVRAVDPDQPMARPVEIPKGHAEDELGELVLGINDTLLLLNREQESLRHMATRDALTALPNRALLGDRLQQSIARAERSGTRVAVMCLDLDRFKHVNDSLGHRFGDLLLQEVGRRIENTIRSVDTVGRLGADEFLIVVESVIDTGEVVEIGSRVLLALGTGIDLEGHRVHVSATIGVALYPDDCRDSGSLFQAADAAMHAAKADAGGRLGFYSGEMTQTAYGRLRIEANLRNALELGQFVLYYQPKVRASDLSLAGVEALIRWRQGDRLVLPGDFIPVAEETGMVVALNAWVLETACADLGRWQREGLKPVPVAVNLSARDLMDPGLPDRVSDALGRHGVQASLLEIEITETTLMRDLDRCIAVLNHLRDIGVSVAVDDFGTGYSSLAYLRRLPIDVLKIDRAFVTGLPEDPVIASVVIALGQRLGLKTVAEGVETEAQRAWLVGEKCDLIQGWLVSRAVPVEDLELRYLQRHTQAVA